MNYTELQVTTNFSFLRGGSHPEELVAYAFELGYKAIAITDRNTLAGIVRAHAAAKGKDTWLDRLIDVDLHRKIAETHERSANACWETMKDVRAENERLKSELTRLQASR